MRRNSRSGVGDGEAHAVAGLGIVASSAISTLPRSVNLMALPSDLQKHAPQQTRIGGNTRQSGRHVDREPQALFPRVRLQKRATVRAACAASQPSSGADIYRRSGSPAR